MWPFDPVKKRLLELARGLREMPPALLVLLTPLLLVLGALGLVLLPLRLFVKAVLPLGP